MILNKRYQNIQSANIIVILFIFLFLPVTLWSTPVKGKIYLDKNKNGVYDKNEKGVANVLVTDGIKFVKTDSNGNYYIDAKVDILLKDKNVKPILTVSWPDGYWPSTKTYIRIENYKNLEKVHFGLVKEKQKTQFNIVQVADLHIPRNGLDKSKTVKEDLTKMSKMLKFAIFTGDNVDLNNAVMPDKAQKEYEYFMEHLKDYPIPYFIIPGNHDHTGTHEWVRDKWDNTASEYGYGLYHKLIGPLKWSFTYGGAHFVGIDYMRIRKDGIWDLGVPEATIPWLQAFIDNVKADKKPIYLFIHYPETTSPGPDPCAKKLRDILKQGHIKHLFTGHQHREFNNNYAGVPHSCGGSCADNADKDRENGLQIIRLNTLNQKIETFFKFNGNDNAIVLDSPRHDDKKPLNVGEKLKGKFYDPENRINKALVTYGKIKRELKITNGDMFSTFEGVLFKENQILQDAPIIITITDGEKEWSYSHKYPAYIPN